MREMEMARKMENAREMKNEDGEEDGECKGDEE
jgi:hypothetical protein